MCVRDECECLRDRDTVDVKVDVKDRDLIVRMLVTLDLRWA